ncbi:GTPase Obg/CgtA [Candidatus Hepatincolaceae symbiont of Richtersius coronifer]
MRFLDSAKIYLKAGNGGKGSVSFRREKYIEYGGPDGGSGGKGGDIIFESTESLNTLIDFRYQQHFKAPNGKGGKGRNKSGENGEDFIIKVPVGTVILNEDKSEVIYDLNLNKQKIIFLEGGIGGLGNASFKNSRNQAPRFAQPGIEGQELWVWLELEILADIGMIGLPNVGKSTLTNAITHAKSKIANYAFTTLKPSLGVLSLYDDNIVIADLPGLIEGANEGLGLGIRFLSHIKRCKAFLHILDATSENIKKSYNTVINEIKEYNETLLDKPQIIVLNKIDLIDHNELKKLIKKLEKLTNNKIICISAVSPDSLTELLKEVYKIYNESKPLPITAPWSPI